MIAGRFEEPPYVIDALEKLKCWCFDALGPEPCCARTRDQTDTTVSLRVEGQPGARNV